MSRLAEEIECVTPSWGEAGHRAKGPKWRGEHEQWQQPTPKWGHQMMQLFAQDPARQWSLPEIARAVGVTSHAADVWLSREAAMGRVQTRVKNNADNIKYSLKPKGWAA